MKVLRIILSPGMLFFMMSLSAQQPGIGIKAGLNSSCLSGYDGENRLGIHAGFFAHAILDEHWRVQPEILYTGHGQKYTVDGVENVIALNYVAIPVSFQYFPSTSFYIEAGPQLAFLASAFNKSSADEHLNLKRSFGNTEFGLHAGAGIFLHDRLGIYARYHLGLTDVTSEDSDTDHNNAIQLGVSFRFNQAGKK
jgi:hypothetical protein